MTRTREAGASRGLPPCLTGEVMTQLTAEERRRISANRQLIHAELPTPRSASITPSEPRWSNRRLSRILQMTVVAALLSVGWFVSREVTFHVPASLAEMLPRL